MLRRNMKAVKLSIVLVRRNMKTLWTVQTSMGGPRAEDGPFGSALSQARAQRQEPRVLGQPTASFKVGAP